MHQRMTKECFLFIRIQTGRSGVRIPTGTSASSLIRIVEILPVPCQYIFSLVNFFVNNQENFQTNPSVRSISIRNKHHLYGPITNLSCFQKSAFYSSIRIFNSLSHSVTNLKNEKAQFKVAVRRYLHAHSFCSVDEFLMCTDKL
jgi:hypothetical protein